MAVLATKQITRHQAISLIALFIFGNNVMIGVNSITGKDSWLAVIGAAILCIPILMMYGRILSLNPEQGFFDIIFKLWGKAFGTVATLLMVWFSLHSGALTFRSLYEFIIGNTLTDPPYLLFPMILLLIGLYLIRGGLSVLGKWSVSLVVYIFLLALLTAILSLKMIDPEYLQPVLRHSVKDMAIGTTQIMSFPFLETVILLPIVSTVKCDGRYISVLLKGLLLAMPIMIYVTLRNTLILGEPLMDIVYYPTFTAVQTLHIGGFLTRIEESISTYMILTCLTKIAVCLGMAANGVARISSLPEPEKIAAPMGLLLFAISLLAVRNMGELITFIKYYPMYTVTFQLLIPLALWLTAEWKNRRQKKAGLPS